MGCDGGTIPKRDELVRQKKKKEEKDKQSELNFRWGHCSITQEPLQKPVVSCQLGKLYSKISVIEALLDKTKLPPTVSHIKSIKDVKELTLTRNPIYKDKAKTSEVYDDSLAAQYICPIIGLEMAGRFRFVLLWSCGCVMSERAFKEVNDKLCPKCQKPVTSDDIIVLNGTEDDVNDAKEKMVQRIKTMKAKKKNKNVVSNNLNDDKPSTTTSDDKPSTSTSDDKCKATMKRSAPAALDIADPLFKKTKSDYSISKDPKATEVYKSLFTSHDKAINQTKAHWVTYNPFYN